VNNSNPEYPDSMSET